MPVVLPRPTRGRPFDPADDGGDAAADAVLPRPRAAPGAADDDGAEVLPHAGHRGGRARHLPPDLLRDARELLVRPVLQGRRDRVRDGVHPRAPEARLGPDLGERPRRRPGVEARPGRSGDRALGEDRDAARADRSAAELGELLVGRRAWAVRAGLGDLLRLRPGSRLRRARLPPRLHALRAVPRVLEPRLHGVRAPSGRDPDPTAEAEHRHRPGARARGADRSGHAERLRHGWLSADHVVDRRSSPASRTATRRMRPRRTASWPTTGAA